MSIATDIDEETIAICNEQRHRRNMRQMVEQSRRDSNRAHDDRRAHRRAGEHEEEMKALEVRREAACEAERQAETKRMLAEYRTSQNAMRYVSRRCY